MGIDIGGATIVKTAGIALNSLDFNAAGQGSARPIPGYLGWKGGGSQYSPPAGWQVSIVQWGSGLNTAYGMFTCPVTGLYAMGYNGIHNGGANIPAGYNTYGYAGFIKNGALSYYVHWNLGSQLGWDSNGASAFFSCVAGDVLALVINSNGNGLPNTPNAQEFNYGLYPDEHHAVWCKLVG